MPKGTDRLRGAALAAPRFAGTVLLTLATSLLYAGGLWAAWLTLFSHLALPLGIAAIIGTAIAPVQLVADIVMADRADRAARDAGIAANRGKDETVD